MFKMFVAAGSLVLILSGIAAIFWQQELQYIRPTPVPAGYLPVVPGTPIAVQALLSSNKKPLFLHFFNPECPCSRFNLRHFKSLVKRYHNEIAFYAVVPPKFSQQAGQLAEDWGLTIPVLADVNNNLARSCGVYATPQAALIDSSGKLYYRGNYNKSRYCTLPNSNFAQMSIDSLLAGGSPPVFGEIATQSYGCTLATPKAEEFFFPDLY